MIKTTISSKGQIAIPKTVRERLNLKAGTEISIDVQGQALVLNGSFGTIPTGTRCGECSGAVPIFSPT
jgi:AbrB family looped-hinge helix DNA binding protein